MKPKNSPGAITALGRVAGHLAKALIELRQAERELERVRGLGVMGPRFLTDVGFFKVLEQLRESLKAKAEAHEGLRLVEETPEENLTPTAPIRPRPQITVEDLSIPRAETRDILTEAARKAYSTFVSQRVPWEDRTPTIPSSVRNEIVPKCPRCEEYLGRGPVGGGHFDWLECEFCAPIPEKKS